MKKIFLSVLFIFAALLFGACSNESSNNDLLLWNLINSANNDNKFVNVSLSLTNNNSRTISPENCEILETEKISISSINFVSIAAGSTPIEYSPADKKSVYTYTVPAGIYNVLVEGIYSDEENETEFPIEGKAVEVEISNSNKNIEILVSPARTGVATDFFYVIPFSESLDMEALNGGSEEGSVSAAMYLTPWGESEPTIKLEGSFSGFDSVGNPTSITFEIQDIEDGSYILDGETYTLDAGLYTAKAYYLFNGEIRAEFNIPDNLIELVGGKETRGQLEFSVDVPTKSVKYYVTYGESQGTGAFCSYPVNYYELINTKNLSNARVENVFTGNNFLSMDLAKLSNYSNVEFINPNVSYSLGNNIICGVEADLEIKLSDPACDNNKIYITVKQSGQELPKSLELNDGVALNYNVNAFSHFINHNYNITVDNVNNYSYPDYALRISSDSLASTGDLPELIECFEFKGKDKESGEKKFYKYMAGTEGGAESEYYLYTMKEENDPVSSISIKAVFNDTNYTDGQTVVVPISKVSEEASEEDFDLFVSINDIDAAESYYSVTENQNVEAFDVTENKASIDAAEEVLVNVMTDDDINAISLKMQMEEPVALWKGMGTSLPGKDSYSEYCVTDSIRYKNQFYVYEGSVVGGATEGSTAYKDVTYGDPSVFYDFCFDEDRNYYVLIMQNDGSYSTKIKKYKYDSATKSYSEGLTYEFTMSGIIIQKDQMGRIFDVAGGYAFILGKESGICGIYSTELKDSAAVEFSKVSGEIIITTTYTTIYACKDGSNVYVYTAGNMASESLAIYKHKVDYGAGNTIKLSTDGNNAVATPQNYVYEGGSSESYSALPTEYKTNILVTDMKVINGKLYYLMSSYKKSSGTYDTFNGELRSYDTSETILIASKNRTSYYDITLEEGLYYPARFIAANPEKLIFSNNFGRCYDSSTPYEDSDSIVEYDITNGATYKFKFEKGDKYFNFGHSGMSGSLSSNWN